MFNFNLRLFVIAFSGFGYFANLLFGVFVGGLILLVWGVVFGDGIRQNSCEIWYFSGDCLFKVGLLEFAYLCFGIKFCLFRGGFDGSCISENFSV